MFCQQEKVRQTQNSNKICRLFVASDKKHVIVDIESLAKDLRKKSKEAEIAKQKVVTRICELDKAAWNEIDENEQKTAAAKVLVDDIIKEQVLILYNSLYLYCS